MHKNLIYMQNLFDVAYECLMRALFRLCQLGIVRLSYFSRLFKITKITTIFQIGDQKNVKANELIFFLLRDLCKIDCVNISVKTKQLSHKQLGFQMVNFNGNLRVPVFPSHKPFACPCLPICIRWSWPSVCVYQPWPQICIYRSWPTIFSTSPEPEFAYTKPIPTIIIYWPWCTFCIIASRPELAVTVLLLIVAVVVVTLLVAISLE